MAKIRCPKCGTAYDLSFEQPGQSVRCNRCQQLFVVPEPPPLMVGKYDTSEPERQPQPEAKPMTQAERNKAAFQTAMNATAGVVVALFLLLVVLPAMMIIGCGMMR